MLACEFIKFYGAVEDAVIGECDGVHAGLLCARYHLVDLGEAVE